MCPSQTLRLPKFLITLSILSWGIFSQISNRSALTWSVFETTEILVLNHPTEACGWIKIWWTYMGFISFSILFKKKMEIANHASSVINTDILFKLLITVNDLNRCEKNWNRSLRLSEELQIQKLPTISVEIQLKMYHFQSMLWFSQHQ